MPAEGANSIASGSGSSIGVENKQPVRMTLLGNTYITYVLPTTGMHLKVLLRLHHCIASCYPLYGCECRLWLSSYSNWYLFSFRRVLIVHHEVLLHKLYNFCGVDHCGTCFISSCVLVLDKFYTESQTTYILSRWRWMVLWMNFYVSWHSIMAKWLHVNVCWWLWPLGTQVGMDGSCYSVIVLGDMNFDC